MNKHKGFGGMKTRATGTWMVAIALTVSISILGPAYYFGLDPFGRGRTRLVVSTTTSLYDTGLLDAIEDAFESKYPVDVYFISAGTSVAIRHAQRGDADMILVHAPSRERVFLEDGYGVCRKIIAYNFFAIVGPEEDPAGTRGLTSIQALAKIVEAGRNGEVSWVSRGDSSGTHIKEKTLWADAGFNWTELNDERGWYTESGSGMGKTLQVANERSAYTLADMGTYLRYREARLVSLVVVVDAGKELLNVYSAIAVNKTYNPGTNFNATITFIKFLTSEEGQQIINQFGQDRYPQKIFYPVVQLLNDESDSTLVRWIKEVAYFDGQECPEEYQNDHTEMYG
ncbi:MAG: substrate-binding domain-containing protein [Candidatus Bathyarchaeota archaeon]|nr:substrate-binding domain-containing protein [Candidatus Bathyarchaeota archaeon]